MDNAVLIALSFSYSNRKIGEVSRFFRKLYGYENHSHYGRYRSRVPGFLDQLPYVRYSRGLIMVRRDDAETVKKYLTDNGASVLSWEVVPAKEDLEKLQGG